MTVEELGYLPIDWRYVFHLKDGRDITKRGSWLLTTKDGRYAIDERKAELVESVDLYEEEN
ncbi:MAG: hypothetical protein IJ714_01515 [Bacteroidales bacterium]|nr:hypothetical protein [Bacteroidales bacterium]